VTCSQSQPRSSKTSPAAAFWTHCSGASVICGNYSRLRQNYSSRSSRVVMNASISRTVRSRPIRRRICRRRRRWKKQVAEILFTYAASWIRRGTRRDHARTTVTGLIISESIWSCSLYPGSSAYRTKPPPSWPH